MLDNTWKWYGLFGMCAGITKPAIYVCMHVHMYPLYVHGVCTISGAVYGHRTFRKAFFIYHSVTSLVNVH